MTAEGHCGRLARNYPVTSQYAKHAVHYRVRPTIEKAEVAVIRLVVLPVIMVIEENAVIL